MAEREYSYGSENYDHEIMLKSPLVQIILQSISESLFGEIKKTPQKEEQIKKILFDIIYADYNFRDEKMVNYLNQQGYSFSVGGERYVPPCFQNLKMNCLSKDMWENIFMVYIQELEKTKSTLETLKNKRNASHSSQFMIAPDKTSASAFRNFNEKKNFHFQDIGRGSLIFSDLEELLRGIKEIFDAVEKNNQEEDTKKVGYIKIIDLLKSFHTYNAGDGTKSLNLCLTFEHGVNFEIQLITHTMYQAKTQGITSILGIGQRILISDFIKSQFLEEEQLLQIINTAIDEVNLGKDKKIKHFDLFEKGDSLSLDEIYSIKKRLTNNEDAISLLRFIEKHIVEDILSQEEGLLEAKHQKKLG